MKHIYHSPDSFNHIKKIVFLATFFIITPLTLLSSALALVAVSDDSNNFISNYVPSEGAQIFASLPSALPSISGQVVAEDARSELIRQYLSNYNSPLVPYADLIVQTSDNYGIDYRLLTAIAQQESNLCKRIPPNSYNCWGWGIHSRGTLHFSSYEEGIDVVSKGLKDNYIDQGYTTPDEIMKKYTPLSKGSWAFGVNSFMRQMR